MDLTWRLLLGLGAAGAGWLGGMAFLRAVHPWAYQTEFRWWAWTSGAYAALLALVIAWMAGPASARSIPVTFAQFALAGTLLPVCLVPLTAGFSVVLLVTGHAYVVAGIAAVISILLTRSCTLK
jgi:hypothetical protein